MKTEQNHLSMIEKDFTKDEMENYQTVLQFDSNWATQFKRHILVGRDKITARLVASLYRENLVGSYTNSTFVQAEQLEHSAISSGELLMIHFTYGPLTLYARVIGHHAFNRVDVTGPFYWRTPDGEDRRVLHPNEVLDVIINEDTQYQGAAAEQFRDDMENSAAHMTLALSYQALHPLKDASSLLDYIEAQDDPYLTSEQLVVEGHPLHPGAKLRKGMSAQETIDYSSEYQHTMPMQFILLHRDVARTMVQQGTYAEVVYHAFDGLKSVAQQAIGTHAKLEDYMPLIVHPWQYEHIIRTEYQHELDTKAIIPLDYTKSYYAGLSFRTLMPKKPDVSPHIKLSTNVHITGEIRTLSEQTTHNGPLMTNILTAISAQDTLFNNVPTSPVPEIAGAHFYLSKDSQPDEQEQRSEQLGTLFRQNIYDMIDSDSLPLIPSSLVVTHPETTRPLIVELVERFGQSSKDTTDIDTRAQWFKAYAASLIDYVVPLLVKYGIALEAHLQNTIAIFEPSTGAFSHMLIRDFEGLRIDAEQLAQMGYDTAHFHEKSRILTKSQTSVFNKAFYSTIQNHLGELVAALARFYNDAALENTLWSIVRQQIEQCFAKLEAADIDPQRLAHMQDIFFNETIDYKCVTTMRLLDKAHEYTYVKVDNPLSKLII
ncbi:sialic acid synthase [Staphylococcus ursi]|uniref:IucA/IucC family protein n=1 Tax=Staphylococcus sp. MI 10-1553 TaxID=1912064 RepID=UPI0013992A83|nr:IucA/IucC family protein [Staphylococcus sp. MI 10-1553]QHW37585.1 sialic acid synthase [Staphylococcus sp. MI 10-1553]